MQQQPKIVEWTGGGPPVSRTTAAAVATIHRMRARGKGPRANAVINNVPAAATQRAPTATAARFCSVAPTAAAEMPILRYCSARLLSLSLFLVLIYGFGGKTYVRESAGRKKKEGIRRRDTSSIFQAERAEGN